MLLDRIDIDAHGPLQGVELGPFSEHLNVVVAPRGSGKTAISRFIRDALVDRTYPLGMFSSSSGRVVLADQNGVIHCYREQDGTKTGRRRVEFETRGDFRSRFDLHKNSWLQVITESSDADRANASLQIPEAIVDGVITETSVGSIDRVVSACLRCGLDSDALHQSLPLRQQTSFANRNGNGGLDGDDRNQASRALRRELADVEAELAKLVSSSGDYDSLLAHRNQLKARLAIPESAEPKYSESRRRHLQQLATDLQDRARQLRARQSELRRRLADLELDIASCHRAGDPRKKATNQPPSPRGRQDYQAMCADRDKIQHDLDLVTNSLDTCLSEASEVGRTLRSFLPKGHHLRDSAVPQQEVNQQSLHAELREIDERLAVFSRMRWLRTRRSELLKQVGFADHHERRESSLAGDASRWLIRLSGGRLDRLDWTDLVLNRRHNDQLSGVRINGRDANDCGQADRVLATMAIRMAAAELLGRCGHKIPLVFEIPEGLETSRDKVANDASSARTDSFTHADRTRHAFGEQCDHLPSNPPIAAALCDYVQSGGQLLILTSNRSLADQLGRVNARSFQIHPHRVVHPHRPIWRSQYQSENYAGPHPQNQSTRHVASVHSASPKNVSEADVNRNLDLAWRESNDQGSSVRFDSVVTDDGGKRKGVDPACHTDLPPDGVIHRDGVYFGDIYTTEAHPTQSQDAPPTMVLSNRNQVTPASPFFLSVDSPIDQAPSVDAVAAGRLRGVDVTHVTHLMQSDPNRLSDALGLASVDASTIRRWQAECRLACRVPNLRGFDARVLVGCGVTTPGQLAAMHPTDLLREVETFLTTESGRQVLLSGTSQELARITTWIATANRSAGHRAAAAPEKSERAERKRRIVRTMNQRDAILNTGHPLYEMRTHYPVERPSHLKTSTKRKSRNDRGENQEISSKGREEARTNADPSVLSAPINPQPLRFYLDRNRPVVDAPTIGPRMAERLQRLDIETVDDLLTSEPETIAQGLDHHRVDADTVLQWQQQAALVCQIPMLRGHDAQLLVAADVTTPQALANHDANALFAIIDTVARSSEGKRILRGGNPPDLQEVQDWIRWAGQHRSLRAA